MKPRVLWISHFLPYPLRGHGALQRSGNLLRYINLHAEVTLLCLEKLVVPGSLNEFKKELSTEFKSIEFFSDGWDQYLHTKIAAALSPLVSAQPYSAAIYNSKQLTARARELIPSTAFDIIHFDTLGPAMDLLTTTNSAVILNHHNIESAMMRRRTLKSTNFLAKFYLTREATVLEQHEQHYCPRVDLNIVVSEHDAELLKHIAPNSRVAVVPNSVDTDFFTTSKKFDQRSGALFIGGIDWYPNRDAITYCRNDIWPLLKHRNLDLNLVGRETEKLHDPSMRIYGSGMVADVRTYLENNRVFVCPMRDGGGTRTKLLDAMASGIPIVSTTLGAEGLNVVSGEQMLITDDPQMFADYVYELHSNPTLWERLSEAGRKFVRSNYSVDIVGRQLLNAYESVLASRR